MEYSFCPTVVVEAIQKMTLGSRVRVKWKYDLRPRILKIEVVN